MTQPTTETVLKVAEYVETVLAEYDGHTVEVLDLSDDKERAYVTAIDNYPIGGKIFVRHQGWCDSPSTYVPVGELKDIRTADVTEVTPTEYRQMVGV